MPRIPRPSPPAADTGRVSVVSQPSRLGFLDAAQRDMPYVGVSTATGTFLVDPRDPRGAEVFTTGRWPAAATVLDAAEAFERLAGGPLEHLVDLVSWAGIEAVSAVLAGCPRATASVPATELRLADMNLALNDVRRQVRLHATGGLEAARAVVVAADDARSVLVRVRAADCAALLDGLDRRPALLIDVTGPYHGRSAPLGGHAVGRDLARGGPEEPLADLLERPGRSDVLVVG